MFPERSLLITLNKPEYFLSSTMDELLQRLLVAGEFILKAEMAFIS